MAENDQNAFDDHLRQFISFKLT